MFTDYRILFLFLVPIALTTFFMYRASTRQSWRDEHADFNWLEAGANFILFIGVTALMWYWGRDIRINAYTEQIGGFVIQKWQVDGDHQESYECNCSTDSEGNRSCSTCWRTVDHREFYVTHDIGDWFGKNQLYERRDSPCYGCEPYFTPEWYSTAFVGKPVSFDNHYPNYLAAVNEVLHRVTYEGLKTGREDICPETPDIRQNETQVFKAIPLGFDKDDPVRHQVYGWNFYAGPVSYMNGEQVIPTALPMYMDTTFGYLGKAVQGDVHIYVVNSTDAQYGPMCLAKWRNGAKNSISVFIFGTSDGTNYQPSNVYVGVGVDGARANTGLPPDASAAERSNYYLKFDLTNQLLDYFQQGGLDRESIIRIVFDNVSQKFVRQEMATFEAMKSQVKPTNGWIFFMAVVLGIGTTVLHFVFANNDF